MLRDLSADQCEINADCDAIPQLHGRQCIAGVCVGDTTSVAGSGGMSGGDNGGTPNAGDAGDQSSGGSPQGGKTGTAGGGASAGSGGGVVPPECTTHAQCMDKSIDGAAACIDGNCVPLLTDECPVILPVTDDLWITNLRNTQNPVILGAYADVPTNLISNQIRNYDLALTEFTRRVNGLPGSGGKRRGVVAVVCRNKAPVDLKASGGHLIDDLHVPGIVTALLADDVQQLFESKAQDAHVMLMSPLDSDSTLVSLQDDGLVWQMLPGGSAVAVTYAPLLERTVAHLVADGTLASADATLRVALITASDVRLLSDISNTVSKTITFNGKSAAANLTDGNFKAIGITSVYKDKNADLTAQVQAVLAFKPHVIIADAADEFLAHMVPSIESGWAAAAPGQKEPFYLLSPFHYNNPELAPLLQSHVGVRTRFAGVNFASALDQSLYNTYQIAFDTAYPEDAGQRGYENFYDSAYYLIYAAAAAGNVPALTGDDLARGMSRLLSGPAWGVGYNDIPMALSALSSSSQSKITLNGTDGPPSWDPGTGEKLGPGSIWCVDSSSKAQSDVLRYDGTSKSLTGTFPCFTF